MTEGFHGILSLTGWGLDSGPTGGAPVAGGFVDILNLCGVTPGGIPSGPLFDYLRASQRDTNSTFLVDIDFALSDQAGVGNDLSRTMQYSFGTANAPGVWVTATPQPFDRHHTASAPLPPVNTVAPGTPFTFVWQAFEDLPLGTFQFIWVRVTATDVAFLSGQAIYGPFVVTTEQPVPVDPLQSQLTRRAALARTSLDFLGNGLLVPFGRGDRDFVSGSDVALIRSSVRTILNTRAAVGNYTGDLPWRPDFGNKMWVLRLRNNGATTRGQAVAFVLEALRWEPRVRVTEVFVEREPFAAANELRVRVRYRIIDENVTDNRVLLPEFEESVTI